MKRRTKIVCTLGPSVNTKSKIKSMVGSGMNVARFNTSHGDWETRKQWAEWIAEFQPALSPVAILVDLQGPKFRIGPVTDGEITLKPGQTMTIARKGDCTISIDSDDVWSKLCTGDRLLLGDGDIEVKVTEKTPSGFNAKALSGGIVKSRQGVTLVGKSFDVPALTEKDRSDVIEAAKIGADYIALSYVRRAEDMRELRMLVFKHDPSIKIVAKIETKEGLKNIDEIIKESDAVMVARGDLGLQMDIKTVPAAQKKVIAKCNAAGVPVITATQMLESMLHSPRPTRAEASDVANAILDGTDAVMLSGETATGQYPLQAVQTMAGIAENIEPLIDHRSRMSRKELMRIELETDAVAHAAIEIASALGAKAVVTSSTSGATPRLVSRYRPPMPVLCACWNEQVQRQLALVWGVEAALVNPPTSTDDAVRSAVTEFLSQKRISAGTRVVVTAGVPPGVPGKTNMVLVHDV